MKTIGVIQARLGSSRLPRKVLAGIAGKPMLLQIVERLRACRRLDEVVISTSSCDSDDELVYFAKRNQIRCFRGPVDDIAVRLYEAARGAGADVFARVWGDCPLIAPGVIDQVVDTLHDGQFDYATNVMRGQLSFPDGQDVEVYRTATIAALIHDVTDPKLREFPQEWLVANQQLFKLGSVSRDDDLSDWHISVDYPEDLEAMRTIYAALADRGLDNELDTLVRLLREEPGLLQAFSGAPRNIEYQAYLKEMATRR
ncbi:MAG: cytidylyltransferase domain-containing protein [Sphingomonadales bacterium]